MASPVLARSHIRSGYRPQAQIRTYEFLNYYNVHYQSPEAGSLRLVPQIKQVDSTSSYELQIGVQSPDVPAQRPKVNLTFVLDTSGSMSGTGIAHEKAILKAVSSALIQGDIVSVVTWNTSSSVLLSGHVFTGSGDTKLVQIANGLVSDGGTDLSAGLAKGYQLAAANYAEDRVNRVVLVSDGGANVGVTDANLIGQQANDNNQAGIYMVGVGAGSYLDESLMNTVTDAGNGAYVVLDSEEEATRMFAGRFTEVFDVAARNVQTRMTLPWYFKVSRFFGEQISVDPTEVKPQHLAPGDSMVYSQILSACAPEVVQGSDILGFDTRWTVPGTYEMKTVHAEATLDQLLAQAKPELLRGHAIIAYAEALKVLQQDSSLSVAQVFAPVQGALDAADPSKVDPDLNEIRDLIAIYPGW
ncbi:MAG: VWA domain-containing protein [Polyangiaceae bacterium]